jgi:TonB family protein
MKVFVSLFFIGTISIVAEAGWAPSKLVGMRYPPLANQARIEGIVKLTVTLNPNGTVAKVEIVSGNRVLAEAAVENLKEWVFERCSIPSSANKLSAGFKFVFRLEGETESPPRSDFRFEQPNTVYITAPAQRWQP